MDNKYNIKDNVPNLSKKDIEKHMDFDALYSSFEDEKGEKTEHNVEVEASAGKPQNTPVKSKGKSFSLWSLAMLAAASLAVFFTYKAVVKSATGLGDSALEQFADLVELRGPFGAVATVYNKMTIVDASKNDTLQSAGTTLIVEGSTFMDDKGADVAGRVDLEVYEMLSTTDMMIAGVSPDIQKGKALKGVQAIAIRAFDKDGKAVYVKPGKKIKVKLVASVAPDTNLDNIKVYDMGADGSNWKYMQVDSVRILEGGFIETGFAATAQQSKGSNAFNDTRLNPADVEVMFKTLKAKAIRKQKLVKPIRPRDVPAGKKIFHFDIEGDFPELARYEGLEFIMDAKVFKELVKVEWDDIQLKKKGDNFEAVLYKDGKSVKETVEPIITYTEKAEAAYKVAVDTYNKKAKALEANVYKELEIWKKEQLATLEPQNIRVEHQFTVDRCGLWGCAEVVDVNDFQETKASYRLGDGSELDIKDVFVKNKTRNIYYKASTSENMLKLSASDDNKVWALTKDNKLVLATEVIEKGGEKVILFTQPDTDITTRQDLYDLLM